MIDPQLLRNDIEAVAAALKVKGHTVDVTAYQALEAKRKLLQIESEELQAKRNAKSKEIGRIKAQGGDVDALMREVNSFADRMKQAQVELDDVKQSMFEVTDVMPNMPHSSVPEGKSEDDNVELMKWGTPKQYDFDVKDHVDLGEALEALDFEAATKIAGPRFVVMKGALARMNRALIQYMLNTHTDQHGYQEVYVPYLVNEDSLKGTGQFSKFAEPRSWWTTSTPISDPFFRNLYSQITDSPSRNAFKSKRPRPGPLA